MASHLRGAEEQQLRSVIETLRKECGSGPRGSYKFRAIVKTVAAQLRALSDSPVRTASDIGSVKQPMPADLRGLHARFPPVHFCLAICGLKVVSGHIERDPLVFTIARGAAVATLIEAFATADELASESSSWRSNARRDSAHPGQPESPGGGGESVTGRRPATPANAGAGSSSSSSSSSSSRGGGGDGPLEVSERDVEAWFDLIVADEARLDALGHPPPADGEGGAQAVLAWREKALVARRQFTFPLAMQARFPALRLYTGDVVGVGGGGRASGDDESWAVTCSLAVMTAALRAHAAATAGEQPGADGGAGRLAVGVVSRAQTRGPTLFGDNLAAMPLSLLQLERWGADLRSHAPTAGALAASYLAVVLHDLEKLDRIITPTKSMHPSVPDESLLGWWLASKDGGKAAGLTKLSAHYRTLLIEGFKAGFNAAQAVQGEAAAAAAVPIARFLRKYGSGSRGGALFLDHYMLDTAGVLGAPTLSHCGFKQGFVTSMVMDGYTFPAFARFIARLGRLG